MKYKIEGDIDFFKELSDLTNTNTNTNISIINSEKQDENTHTCLITCEPLTDFFVVMSCGHKFNYIPLFKDIYNHKKKFNSMESSNQYLKLNEIRCPYCRNKQKGVLPFYNELGLEKVNGVNFINLDTKMNTKTEIYIDKKCDFILNEDLIKEKNVEPIYCNKFFYLIKKNEIENINEKFYCIIHKKIMIAREKKIVKEKEKQEIIQAKLKAKELEKAEKLLLKLEKKQNIKPKPKIKPKTKMEELNAEIQEENVILEEKITCTQILKSGPNKGSPCANKVFENGLCKRHFEKKIN
jgi:hypothetical protein